ncbi:phosphate acetyltransferase [bacterium]|nr:MAG: phosphate acetyltransferase [bacterium]
MKLLDDIRAKARQIGGTVVLPEGDDPRMILAAEILLKEKISKVIIVGNQDNIMNLAKQERVDISSAEITDPEIDPRKDDFAMNFWELRKHKGLTLYQAKEAMKNPLYWGAMLVRAGFANCAVAGAKNTTGNVLRSAIHCLGTATGVSVVSSCFLMVLPEFIHQKEKVFVFADCAVIPQPDPQQLASIAIASAKTAKQILNIEPKIAMLSFSTKGSANHQDVDKVRKAVDIIREQAPDLSVDGELQVDAAIIPSVATKKAPDSSVAGEANILIFPDLDAGNIGYKLVQRMAGAEAIGPIIQGLAKPFNDLSRGCSVEDIVNVSAISLLKSID